MVTVLTPTYNRSNDLKKLYKSLCIQSNKSFEWLIVDDGSDDDTEKNVEQFVKEKQIDIKYVKKENGGKHTALNVGIQLIDSLFTFIVDSDDCLSNDAIEEIFKYHEKYQNYSNICGFSFLRKTEDGIINGKRFEKDEVIGTLIDVRINGNDDSSDKAEVYYTDILKKYPFPEYEGEKFLGEDVVWMRMAREYSMVFINKAIYIGTYLDDGLTKNRRKHNIKSPNGCVERAQEYMKKDVNWKLREKSALQYLIYGWFAKRKTLNLIFDAESKILVLINCIPARIIYMKWKKEFEEK